MAGSSERRDAVYRSRPAPLGPPRFRSEDPRLRDPNENLAGPNVPPVSVGPTSSTNAPGNFVALPASSWSGWPGPDSTGIGPSPWDTPYLEPFGPSTIGPGGTYSGFGYGRMSEEGYLRRVSTVMTCVDLNSRQIASFPIYGVRGHRPETLPSWAANPEPEIYADWSEFAKVLANSYQLAGETLLYATGRFSNGYPARFIALNPFSVEIDEESGRWYLGDEELDPRDVLQIKYQALPPPKRRGIGPLGWTGRNLVSAAALERYTYEIATHGVRAVLKAPGNLNRGQADDLKANWMTSRATWGGAPAVLSGGIDFETLSLSPKDMALLDLKVYDEQRIASAFGVPPFLVGLEQPGSMVYSNASSLFDHHWRATLRPMAQSFSGALSRWLLPRDVSIEFNRDEYVRPGLGERASTYATLHGIVDEEGRPTMAVNEIRVAERLAPYGPVDVERGVASPEVVEDDVDVLALVGAGS